MPYIHPDDKPMLYRTSDDRIVEEGDPDAAFVLVGPGGTLSDADAEKYGLTGKKGQKAPSENKMMEGSEANKEAAPTVTRDMGTARVIRAGEGRLEQAGEPNATSAAVELAEEHNINLADVKGSGEGGRILKSDVEKMVEGDDK